MGPVLRRLAVGLGVAFFRVPAPALPASARATTIAYKVVLERSGGFAGRHDTYVVDRDVRQSARVLRLAGSAAFRRLHASYVPANPCCDRFNYRLTAYYRG